MIHTTKYIEPEKVFRPIELTITIESEIELEELRARLKYFMSGDIRNLEAHKSFTMLYETIDKYYQANRWS